MRVCVLRQRHSCSGGPGGAAPPRMLFFMERILQHKIFSGSNQALAAKM